MLTRAAHVDDEPLKGKPLDWYPLVGLRVLPLAQLE